MKKSSGTKAISSLLFLINEALDFNTAVSQMIQLFTSREVVDISLLAKYSASENVHILSNE